MISPKRIKLLLAVILAASSLVFLFATFSAGGATAVSAVSGPTLKSKILRRNDRLNLKLDDAEKAALKRAASPAEEREFEDKIPKHLPIKVKLRAEKEKAAKDLSNNRWHRDLEIEVKNTGDKPIYYLSFIIGLPEIRLGGNRVSVHVRYGQHSLFDNSKGRAAPEDVPLKPKDTYVLTLDEEAALAWEQWREREKWSQPKKVEIEFEQLNFGDGTGFFGGNGAPWPFPKSSQPLAEVLFPAQTNSKEFKSHHAGPRVKTRRRGIL